MGLQHLACQQSLCALTIVNVVPRIAIEAPGVDLAHIWTNAQPLPKLHSPIQTAPRRVTYAIVITFGVPTQAGAFRYKCLLHQAATSRSNLQVHLVRTAEYEWTSALLHA